MLGSGALSSVFCIHVSMIAGLVICLVLTILCLPGSLPPRRPSKGTYSFQYPVPGRMGHVKCAQKYHVANE